MSNKIEDTFAILSSCRDTALEGLTKLHAHAIAAIEQLRGELAQAQDGAEKASYDRGYADGARAAMAHVVAQAVAAMESGEPVPEIHSSSSDEEQPLEDPSEFLPRSLTAEDREHIGALPPAEAPDAAFLRQALAERAAEPDASPESELLAMPVRVVRSSIEEIEKALDAGISVNISPDGCVEIDGVRIVRETSSTSAQAETEESQGVDPAAGPVSDQDETEESQGVDPAAGPVSDQDEETGPVEAAPDPEPVLAADRPMGERPAGPVPSSGAELYWTPERHKLLASTIASCPNEAELLAAFPDKSWSAIVTQCYAQSLPAPTKTRLSQWAVERQQRDQAKLMPAEEEPEELAPASKPTGPGRRITVDDLINKIRITGDTAFALDSPLFRLFEVNGKKMDRAELLGRANKYRVRAGLAPWEPDQVAWLRPLPIAPQKARPPFSGPAK